MRFSIIFLFCGMLWSLTWVGCKKDLGEGLHIDTLITDNDPPPYSGVSDVQVTNYINKLYIDLLGRAPTSTEINDGLIYLETHSLRETARDTLIQQLMDTYGYYKRIFDLTSADFINATDSTDIDYEIQLIYYLYYLDSAAGNTLYLIYYQSELHRLGILQNITVNYMNGLVSTNEFFAAFLDNYFYDQVNMGSENFVKGSFSDLFRRSTTISELASGVLMVDSAPAILFLQDGDSKGDYINIVTHCNEFYEGLVLKTYQQLLLRDPNSEELASGTINLQQTNSYSLFQKQLMRSVEYAGF